MARAVPFHGANKVFAAPPGREDVSDLHTFVNGVAIVSAWQLDPDELEEVRRTGRIFLSSLSGDVLYPVYVGSEGSVRRIVADYGKVWPRDGGGERCSSCTNEGTRWPLIRFGPARQPPVQPTSYRLAVPKLLCSGCLPRFRPEAFFSPQARAEMARMLEAEGMAAPDFDRIEVEWRSTDDPEYQELRGGGEARLWFR